MTEAIRTSGSIAAMALLFGSACFHSSTPLAPAEDAGVLTDASPPGWMLRPINATFAQPSFATAYYAFVDVDQQANAKTLRFSATLQLTLVDNAGAPDPTTPGSGAAVDTGCDNAGVGTSSPVVTNAAILTPSSGAKVLIWYHPDAIDSMPPGMYHCDHSKQGPSGHQGLITVVVSDSKWQCTAQYKGTLSSDSNSVANGFASEPVCVQL